MKKTIKVLLVLLGLGFLYFIWLKVTHMGIPCIFRKVTGWLCPGCGVTTLLLCLSELDFRGAYEANPFLFVTGPFLIAELAYYFYLEMKERTLPAWNNVLVILYAIALCIFGVWRNIV